MHNKAESGEVVDIKLWGKDHWSLLAYIITMCVDYRGNLDAQQLRRDGSRYPTRLKQGEAFGHSDFNCIEDMEQNGLVQNLGTGLNPIIKLTQKGWAVANKLQQHKANGGDYGNFLYK